MMGSGCRRSQRLALSLPIVLLLLLLQIQLLLETPICEAGAGSGSFPSANIDAAAGVGSTAPPGVRVDLTHRDSVYQPAGSTITALWRQRVKRSILRAATLTGSEEGDPDGAGAFPPSGSYQTPVAAASGEYLAKLSIGTPAQSFNTILDTGSDLTWLQSDPCRRCYAQNEPHFKPAASSTFRLFGCRSAQCAELPLARCESDGACNYAYQYGDGSFTIGNYSSDTLTLAASSGQQELFPGFRFGCGFNNRGTFRFAGGLLGLGRGSFSFTSQLGASFGSQFSYCLLPLSDSFTGKTSPLLLGGAAAATMAASPGAVQFTPLLSNPRRPSLYYLAMQAVLVDGVEVAVPAGTYDIDAEGNGGTIIDSGTTLTGLTERAYQPVLEAVRAKSSGVPAANDTALGLELCFAVADGKEGKLPEITLVFLGAKLVLPEGNAFVLVADGVVCWAFFRLSADSFSILGNVQQQQFQIFHDLHNSRVGFVPADCETL